MAQSQMLQRIGKKLREESRDVAEAKLPERLRMLVDRLASLEKRGQFGNGDAVR